VNGQLWWHLARASGIVAWIALTASVIWGIILASGAFQRSRRPAWLLDLHRWLAALTVAFVAVHLAALVADNYVPFGLADLTIPFAADWRTGAVALGVLAAWLLAAIQLTSLTRRRLPRRAWHAIHLTSYVTFWLTSLHAAFAGTDRANRLYQATTIATIGVVVWATIYRINSRRRPQPPNRAGRPQQHRPQTPSAPMLERTP
jgi:DMSO/TMAO reductase YedYZ heme-binding membrane subunit